MGDKFGGSEFQATPPNPIRIPDRLGQEVVQGVVPLHRAGAPVRSLAFTGRGITITYQRASLGSDANTVSMRSIKRIPFRGLVRSFAFGSSADARIRMGCFYSEMEHNYTYTVMPSPDDQPCYEPDRMNGFYGMCLGNYAVGGWWSVPLNFLLPYQNPWLNFAMWNNSGESADISAYAEVLEVIPEI